MNRSEKLCLTLPAWLAETVASKPVLAGDEERMRFVVELSRRNVLERTGGPFAAAVFEEANGRLVGAGVNRVEPLGCSAAHAEVLALAFAQKWAGSFDLGKIGRCQLISSAQPCAMCFGALLWSGVSGLVYAALRRDVEAVTGFDEGPLPRSWRRELERRGIRVRSGLLRGEAVAVLELYRELGLTVYSPRRSK